MDHNRKHINRKYILLVWYKDPIRRVIQCQSLCTTCAALQIYRSRPGVGYGFGQKIIFIFIWLCIFNIQLLSKYTILPISYNSLNSKPIPCLTLPAINQLESHLRDTDPIVTYLIHNLIEYSSCVQCFIFSLNLISNI